MILGLPRARVVHTKVGEVLTSELHGSKILTIVKAEVVDGSVTAKVPWDPNLGVAENHCAAAIACMGGLSPHSYWPAKDGYMFTF